MGELPRPGQKPKFDVVQAATIVDTARSSVPGEREHWTLRMLGAKAVELGFVRAHALGVWAAEGKTLTTVLPS